MAAVPTIQPTDHYATTTYTGTGSTLVITGIGFEPNFLWTKSKPGAAGNNQWDTVRGIYERIKSEDPAGEYSEVSSLTAWGSDGYTFGTDGSTNVSGAAFFAAQWHAATTGTDLSAGTITPSSSSINVVAGMSIIAYTGTGANATIAHGLGKIPTAIIVKQLNTARDWTCYHTSMGNTYRNWLNLASAASTGSTVWNDTSPTSTLFTVGSGAEVNESGGTYIAYVWAPIQGFSNFGSHQGHSSNVDGAYVYTGFKPSLVIYKNMDGGDIWISQNKISSPFNVVDKYLVPSATTSETTSSTIDVDFLSNGFKIRASNNALNYTTQKILHWAWAESPFVSSTGVPGTAR